MIAFGILFGWDAENHNGWQFGKRVLCGRDAAPPTIAYLQGLGAEQIYRGRFARRFAVDAPSYLGRV